MKKRLIIEVDEEFYQLVKKYAKMNNLTMRQYLYRLIFREIYVVEVVNQRDKRLK